MKVFKQMVVLLMIMKMMMMMMMMLLLMMRTESSATVHQKIHGTHYQIMMCVTLGSAK